MKAKYLIHVVLLFLICGCVTTNNIKEQTKDDTSVEDILSMAASAKINIGDPVYSLDSGIVDSTMIDLPQELSNPIVLNVSHKYYYNNEVYESDFEIIYLSVESLISSNKEIVVKNQKIGTALADSFKILARSKILDKYLISVSEAVPLQYNGYWYYSPGMYLPYVMKWLSFEPADYDQFKSMYDHATTGEEALGMTTFFWWSLLKTSLSKYPENVLTARGNSLEQLIYFDDIPLRLYYQPGFLEYLKKEYSLNDPIFLYLQITSINGFSKEYSCHVRDFSLVPPENIIDERYNSVLVK